MCIFFLEIFHLFYLFLFFCRFFLVFFYRHFPARKLFQRTPLTSPGCWHDPGRSSGHQWGHDRSICRPTSPPSPPRARLGAALPDRASRRLTWQRCPGASCSLDSNQEPPGHEDGGVDPQVDSPGYHWCPGDVPESCEHPGDVGESSGRAF